MDNETNIFKLNSVNIGGVIVEAHQNFLIIDDDDDLLDNIGEFIEILGFKGKILKAANINESKKFLKYDKVNFIISDWNLPDGEGIALLKAIRKSKKFQDIPFLMVTGDDSVDSMILSQKYGGSDYLTKPFNLDQFKEKLADAWKTHILPSQDKIHELNQKIIELEEENAKLKKALKELLD